MDPISAIARDTSPKSTSVKEDGTEDDRPLDGLRVLDFTSVVAGPYCTRLLSDLGATVIKVESADGDHFRIRPPMRGAYSNMFGHLNAGKKSVVLDLKSDGGREAALALARKSDVVVENWRPGVAAQLGVGFDSVCKLNSRVVYCSISGFGQTGPSAHRSAYAPIVHAASGFDAALIEQEQGGRPVATPIFIADMCAGMYAFGAIQTALYRLERTGKGQYIDVALVDCIMSILVHECQQVQTSYGKRTRVYRPLQAKDGYIVVAPNSQKNFKQMAAALKQPELLSDPRFANSKERGVNWEDLMKIVEQWALTRSAAECEEILLAAGVPCSRHKDISEVMSDPQTMARGMVAKVSDGAGDYMVFNPPFQMPGLTTTVRAHVPELGEDTSEVLNGISETVSSRREANDRKLE